MEKQLGFPPKLRIERTYDTAVTLLRIYVQNTETLI